MKLDHATPELFTALAQAQFAVENATKGSVNPHFKNRYADLAEVLNTVRPVFSSFGLSIIQNPSFDGAMVSVTTVLGHSGGGYITAVASCVPQKSDAQGVGSATTYLRRYSLASMAGVAQEDDDGQAASHSRPSASHSRPVNPVQAQVATAEDITTIRERMETLGVDEEAFAKHLGVKSIAEITVVKIARAHAALDAKAAKNAQ